jgi:hypothetical protein
VGDGATGDAGANAESPVRLNRSKRTLPRCSRVNSGQREGGEVAGEESESCSVRGPSLPAVSAPAVPPKIRYSCWTDSTSTWLTFRNPPRGGTRSDRLPRFRTRGAKDTRGGFTAAMSRRDVVADHARLHQGLVGRRPKNGEGRGGFVARGSNTARSAAFARISVP